VHSHRWLIFISVDVIEGQPLAAYLFAISLEESADRSGNVRLRFQETAITHVRLENSWFAGNQQHHVARDVIRYQFVTNSAFQ